MGLSPAPAGLKLHPVRRGWARSWTVDTAALIAEPLGVGETTKHLLSRSEADYPWVSRKQGRVVYYYYYYYYNC